MVPRLKHRPDLTELMDRPDVDPDALAENLRDLRRFNRLFGWQRSVISAVARIVENEGLATFRLLDVATGSADIPLAISTWARRRRLHAYIVASDIHAVTLRLAARQTRCSDVRLIRHDALQAPFRTQAFDIAMCNLSLHHFPPQQAVLLLRELGRVARHVLVSDLVRSRFAYWGALMVARLLRHSLTSHDGPVSVLRSYRPEEVRQLAQQAGLQATVRPSFPFRMLLTGSSDRSKP